MATLENHSRIVLAGLLPLGLLGLVGLRRRSVFLRSSILAFVYMLVIGTMSGCSSGSQHGGCVDSALRSPDQVPMTSQIIITVSCVMLLHSVSVKLTTN